MKRILPVLFLFSLRLHAQSPLGAGIEELAKQITASATKQEKQRIAVLPFRELDGQPTVFGRYLAEELVTNLFQLGNFKIVERELLDKVMGELSTQRSGAIDPTTAKEIGRIAAVDAIVTGSITDLGSYVAVNCRLIDATTGEVFGAAQTKILKGDDVAIIMNSAPGEVPPTTAGTIERPGKAIATKEIGSLRVVLQSVAPVAGGMRWAFQFHSREAKRPIVVALNAEGWSDGGDRQNRYGAPTPLRASVHDDRGGVWRMASTSALSGIDFVRVGVHGRRGEDAYGSSEIARLLRLRDQLGRDTDDPSDGITQKADSMGEGGSNVTFGRGGITSPEKFFTYKGNRFVSGSTTTIQPGQSMLVTMTFRLDERPAPSGVSLSHAQFNSEIVVGVVESAARTSYTLHNLTFDRVSVTGL